MTRCCHGNGKTCLRDITGLQPVAALDVAEQMIMRSHDDGFVAGIRSERSLAGGSVTEGIGMFQEQLAAKNRQIARGGDIVFLSSRGRQPVH